MEKKKQFYSWQEFDRDCDELIRRLRPQRLMFNGVWGPARGGLLLAIVLSHGLGLSLLAEPIAFNTLVVDDIADTGKTLHKFVGVNFMVTLFYHQQSVTTPTIWLHEKFDKFIVFPWEKEHQ